MATEDLHPLAMGLDLLPEAEALARLLQGQLQAVQAVQSALPALRAGAAPNRKVRQVRGRGGARAGRARRKKERAPAGSLSFALPEILT